MSKEIVVDQLENQHGWTRDQAVGIAANLHMESSLNPAAVGDGGRAYGIAQWHPDRQAEFRTFAGKDIKGSTLQEQVAFVDYELRKGKEQAAGRRIAASTTAGDAAAATSRFYERPKAADMDAARRGKLASEWAGQTWDAPVGAVAPAPAVQQQGAYKAAGAANADWPVLPQLDKAPKAPSASDARKALAAPVLAAANAQAQATEGQGPDASLAQQHGQYVQQFDRQQAENRTGVTDVFNTSREDPRDQALFKLLDYMYAGPKEVPPAGWTYEANKDAIEKPCGLDDECYEYMRENVTGPNSMAAAHGQKIYRDGLDETYALAGPYANFLGRMGGGMMDPVGMAAGIGVGKVIGLAGIGSSALAAAGRPAAAVASFVAEGALGNVAVEGIQDVLGEVKTSSDYAMAAAMGAMFSAPFTRGVHAEGARAAVEKLGGDMRDAAVREQVGKIMEYKERTGETDPKKIADGIVREEAEAVRRAVDTNEKPQIRDQAVPEDVQTAIRDSETQPQEPPKPPKEEPPEAPPKEATPEQTAKHDAQVKAYEEAKAARERAEADNKQIAEPELRKDPAPPADISTSPTVLPQSLQKAAPSFGYKDSSFKLSFASDIDKALYIVGGSGKSKAHGKYLEFLRNLGFTDAEIARHSKGIREDIKATAKEQYSEGHRAGNFSIAERTNSRPAEAPDTAGLDFPKLDLGVEREIPAADGGKPIKLSWALLKREREGTFSVKEVLDGIVGHQGNKYLSPETRALAEYLRRTISDGVKDVRVAMGRHIDRGMWYGRHTDIDGPSKVDSGASLKEHLDSMETWHLETVLHEMVHAATHSKIEAFKNGRASLSKEAVAGLNDLALLRQKFAETVRLMFPTERAPDWTPSIGPEQMEYALKYAAINMHEFAAQAMADTTVRNFLRRMDGLEVAGTPTSAWQSFTKALAKTLDWIKPGKNDALTQATAIIDRIISADGSNIRYQGGEMAVSGPAQFNGAQQRTYAARMYAHAKGWLATNPVDPAKVRVLTAVAAKWGGLSDGLVLARSTNPILQMVSGLVTETTTGASGRQANAAIRTQLLHRKLIGNSMLEYVNNFQTWGANNGATMWDNVMHGNKRREFDSAVYGEILDRQNPNYVAQNDSSVIAAADSLEAMFERNRQAQIDAGTLGSANLPNSSRGYVPQALDGAKLQTLTVKELAAFHDELSVQFQARMGWDKAFADTFAPYYTDRIRKRAQGSKEVDAMGGGGDALTTIRDTLDDMAFDPATRDRMTSAYLTKAGQGQTKTKLDLDLRKEFMPGRTLLDMYVSDPLLMGRMQSRRVAGSVALTEQGILGVRGVRELREAAATPQEDGVRATNQELEAYDRVMAEILGTPAAGQVVSGGATNLGLLVNLQRLGGLVFTQAMEQWNMIQHVGLRSTLAGIASLPRMLGEVGRMKKGAASGNHILTSIETYGGEIGTESYKMVAPLDPPETRLEDYVKQSGVITRLLRAGGHAQSKLSFFRGLMSAQHRMAAEQIVMKAARFIRDGGDDIALRDMGFTPAIQQAMAADLPRVAQWDANGKLIGFDLTQVSDPRVAEAFVQAVHRGTSQIIQGTFIGERSKWMHNDYARLMLQLRTFGITATEKQLQRTAMIHGGGARGYSYAAGIMIAQIALSMPMHMARVQLAAAGREDRDKFLKDNLNPAALVKAAMNYSSMTGSTGDILELMTATAGGWMGQENKEMIGARTGQATSVGRLIPAAGSIDSAFKVIGGKADLYTGLKQLPFSNLPYLIPAIALTKDE